MWQTEMTVLTVKSYKSVSSTRSCFTGAFTVFIKYDEWNNHVRRYCSATALKICFKIFCLESILCLDNREVKGCLCSAFTLVHVLNQSHLKENKQTVQMTPLYCYVHEDLLWFHFKSRLIKQVITPGHIFIPSR